MVEGEEVQWVNRIDDKRETSQGSGDTMIWYGRNEGGARKLQASRCRSETKSIITKGDTKLYLRVREPGSVTTCYGLALAAITCGRKDKSSGGVLCIGRLMELIYTAGVRKDVRTEMTIRIAT